MLLVLFAPPAGAPSRKNGTLQYVFGPLVHPLEVSGGGNRHVGRNGPIGVVGGPVGRAR